ncbi:MAG: helix-turn-helix domain-containing protein [Rickettsiales bacterium]|nr:helix-turn-helix domain-containing protein [Rickettsiales bacterium]
MITICGFLDSVADDIARYLEQSLGIESNSITVLSDIAPQDGLNIIASDKLEQPCHSASAKCLYIGSKTVAIEQQAKSYALHEPLPIKLPVIKDHIRRWLEENAKAITLIDSLKYAPISKTIIDSSGKALCFLTEKEAELLLFLREHAGEFFDKDTLLKQVWGYQSIDTHTLETHIYRLRSKLSELLPENKGLTTSDNGYSFTL